MNLMHGKSLLAWLPRALREDDDNNISSIEPSVRQEAEEEAGKPRHSPQYHATMDIYF